MRYWLGLSLALNLFLLTTIVAARVDVTREPAAELRAPASQFGSGSRFESETIDGIGDLAVRLEPTGLGGRDIKRLLVGWLWARDVVAGQQAGPRYWQSDYRPGLNDLRRQVEVERRIRDGLIGFFGADAATDPAFEAVFRPLGPEYAFLSSQAQLDLQAHQLSLLESRNAQAMPAGNPMRCPSIAASSNRTMPSMLPEGLDASAVRGYRLRFSPLAQQLRDSVVTDDEQYFQSLFDRLVKLEQDPSPRAQAVIRQELRAQMGGLAFDRFWSSRDPLFLPVENYLVAQGFARRQVFDAYSIINRSQESLLGAIANSRSQDSMLSAVQQIRTDESADLARLLGDEIAAGLAGAMTEAAISLSSVSKTSC